ncbi:MAG: DUF4160 domain-containing protein [Prevotellaceae bacterium]|jgi:hypothetical protein|nr:DUF4160 domain-containing protein [Prevotellaceae bacterium]
MPTIFIFFGLRFVFFSNDHEPIHVHVIRGKTTELAVFQVLPDVKLLKNTGIASHELKMAEAIIEENKEVIIEAWNTFFNRNDHGRHA